MHQIHVHVLKNWCEKSRLSLNLEKTTGLWYGKSELNESIKFDGRDIQIKDEIKYLGMMINKRLKWNKHVESTL